MQDPELVTQLKERLPEALFEKLNGSLSIDQDRLKLAEYKVRVLEEKLRLVRIDKYGPGSEKLSDAQLELLDLEPGVSSAEVQAEGDRGQLKLPLKRAQKHPGRQELPVDLPRVEQMIACTAQQCVCGNCGRETTQIGYETAEQLDVEPAKYFAARLYTNADFASSWVWVGRFTQLQLVRTTMTDDEDLFHFEAPRWLTTVITPFKLFSFNLGQRESALGAVID